MKVPWKDGTSYSRGERGNDWALIKRLLITEWP